MKSKFLNKLLAVATSTALLATSFTTVPATNATAATVPGTVTPRVSVHDPSIIKADGTYYVFGSHLADAKSTDLMKWTQMHSDYGWNRNWKTNSIYGNILTNFVQTSEGDHLQLAALDGAGAPCRSCTILSLSCHIFLFS